MRSCPTYLYISVKTYIFPVEIYKGWLVDSISKVVNHQALKTIPQAPPPQHQHVLEKKTKEGGSKQKKNR